MTSQLKLLLRMHVLIRKSLKPTILGLFAALSCSAFGQDSGYSQKLSDSLGADSYGMKTYVLAILKTGPAKIEDKRIRDSLFRGHFDNITRLVRTGQLIVAGPLEKNDREYRGIFIFNVRTIEEAKALTRADPTVVAGVFEVEYFNWYGSAALPMYVPFHKKIEKETH